MAHLHDLQISTQPGHSTLTPEQKRFNTLIRQIEQARQTLAAWQAQVPSFRQAHAALVQPLLDDLREAHRAWVFALDGVLAQPGWRRPDRLALQEMVCESAGALLDDDSSDAELKAVFDKHSEIDFDTDQQRASQAMKRITEMMTGVDLGDDEGIRNQDDLMRRMQEKLAETAQAQQAQAAEATPRRRPTKAQQRREAEAQQATQSVREVYRKLASALHPDRETDPVQREAKTALMQRVNQAHATGDLLALLELQLEIEQVDAGHIATASAQRVKHYNKVLGEQLAELRAEIGQCELQLRMEFGMPPELALKPDKLGRLVEQQAREVRAELAALRHDLGQIGERRVVKGWIRRHRETADFDDRWF